MSSSLGSECPLPTPAWGGVNLVVLVGGGEGVVGGGGGVGGVGGGGGGGGGGAMEGRLREEPLVLALALTHVRGSESNENLLAWLAALSWELTLIGFS